MGRARPRDSGPGHRPGRPMRAAARDRLPHPGRGGGPDRRDGVRRHPHRAHRGTRRGAQGPVVLRLPERAGPAALPAGRAPAFSTRCARAETSCAATSPDIADQARDKISLRRSEFPVLGRHLFREAGHIPRSGTTCGPCTKGRQRPNGARRGRAGPAEPPATSQRCRHLRRRSCCTMPTHTGTTVRARTWRRRRACAPPA